MSQGRTIAIGDIHGCDTALAVVLEAISPTADDLLIVLGDVIDRGPGTKQCIDRLIKLSLNCRLVHLMGNHEEMFLDTLSGGPWSQTWFQYGGLEMLDSYGGSIDRIPAEHLDFIRNGKDFFETDTHIFVHGFLRRSVPVDQESVQWLRWSRFQPSAAAHCSGKRVICGHTAQASGLPIGNAHYVCIDTCVYCPTGALSALDVEANQLWRATQSARIHEAQPLAELLSG
ncbi:MAG: metallophosphoesterase family protein [Planctomycetaceae bacterium]